MRSRLISAMVGLTVIAGNSGVSVGELIGVLPASPSLVFGSPGGLTFGAASGLVVGASPLAIRFSSGLASAPLFVGPTGDPPSSLMNIHVNVDTMGQLIGGVAGNDLTITGEVDQDGDGVVDFAGLLLTGEVAGFGFEDNIGATSDFYDFRFTCTGGSLAAFFVDQDIGVMVTSEDSDFSGVFTADFAGGAKGIVGAIDPACTAPVPTASLVQIGEGDNEGAKDDDHDGHKKDDKKKKKKKKKHRDNDEGMFMVVFGPSDEATACEPTTCVGELVCGSTRITVLSGELVEIEIDDEGCEIEVEHGHLEIEGSDVFLEVTCTNSAGSVTVQAFPSGLESDNDMEDEDDD